MALSAAIPMAYYRASDGVTGASATSPGGGAAHSRASVPRTTLRDGPGDGIAVAWVVRDSLLGAGASVTPCADWIAPAVRSRCVFS